MFQMLISLFGIAIVYRNLSLLGKFEVLSKRKIFLLSIIFQLPLFLFVFFKEQITLILLFIGVFSLTLIFYRQILMKWARLTYEKRHLRVLDHLILLLKSGKSAQSSLKIVLGTFSNWERLIFQPLETIFEMKERENADFFEVNINYFNEIKIILRSNHQIADQLKSFREGLRIRHNLRHKSVQVTQQIRAQALVAVFIYVILLFISFEYFNLKGSLGILFVSLTMFTAGLSLIFFFGGRIRWKT